MDTWMLYMMMGIAIAVIFGFVAAFATKRPGPRSVMSLIVAGGLILAVYGGVLYADAVPGEQTIVTPTANDWDVEITAATVSGQAHVVWGNTDHTRTICRMSFNDTSNAFVGGTQWVVLNFSLENQGGHWSEVDCTVTTVGDYVYSASGSSTTYKILHMDGLLYDADWTKSSGTTHNMDAIVSPPTTDFSEDYISLNLTANAAVVALMSQHDTGSPSTIITFSDHNTGAVFGTFEMYWDKYTVTT